MEQNLSSLGQHYLINAEVLSDFIMYSEIKKTDTVLEVGAGNGIITQELIKISRAVDAYEIDTRTRDRLDALSQNKKLRIIYRNILKENPLGLNGKYDVIVASLAYQITEPFIELLIKLQFRSCTLIVGKHFATTATSQRYDTKLSLLTACFFISEYKKTISADAFLPPPRTESAIIVLRPQKKDRLLYSPALYIMRDLFEQRDKRIKNALREALINYASTKGINLTKRESKKYVDDYFTIDRPELMMEQMTNKEFAKLYLSIDKLVKQIFK